MNEDLASGSPGMAPMRGAYVGLFVAIGALSAYLPLYYEARGLTLDVIGLLAALYAAVAMIGAPTWGIVADLVGSRAPVVTVAAGLAAVAAGGLAFATDLMPIAIGALALALAMSGIMPILDAQAAGSASRGGYGRFRAWGSLAFIGAVLATGWLTERSSAAAMFAIVAPALALTAVIGVRLRPVAGAAARWQTHSLGKVLRSRELLAFLAALFLIWTSSTTINAFFSLHLVDVEAPRGLVGMAWAIGAAIEIPIMLAYTALQRRFGLDRLLVIGAILLVVRAAAVLVTHEPVLLALTMAIHGAAFALLIVGGVLYAARLAPPGTAATVQGLLVAIVFGLAQVVGPGVGGQLAAMHGILATFAVAATGSVTAVVVLTWVVMRRL